MLDFDQDIYGQPIEVEFVEWLRPMRSLRFHRRAHRHCPIQHRLGAREPVGGFRDLRLKPGLGRRELLAAIVAEAGQYWTMA
ncbi:MAG: riboflavin kinase [Adlercreutzia equolifaciens]